MQQKPPQRTLNISHLSDTELLQQTLAAAKTEKAATLALLDYLCEVDAKKVFATQAYSSLFEYIVKELGYSESQASERVSAVRLMRSTPEVKTHLAAGTLNLTTAAQIQRFVQTEKKLATPLTREKKTNLLNECLNQSKRNVEKILFTHASEPTQIAMKERITQVAHDKIELKIILEKKAEEKLKRAQELVRTETLAQLFEKSLDALIEREEKKLGKVMPKSEKTPPKTLATILAVQQKNSSTTLPKNNAHSHNIPPTHRQDTLNL